MSAKNAETNLFLLQESRNFTLKRVSQTNRSVARLAGQARKNAAKTEREFFETVCAECGGTAKIPFKPVEGKATIAANVLQKEKAAE